MNEAQEESILVRSIEILTRLVRSRPVGYRAPWFEINPWTPALLARHEIAYCASEMGDDVPYFHENGLVEIPGQWMLEDWEQFAFSPDPAWGFVPENCDKVYDLWWREFEAMHDFGCCFVLTLHPWLSGRPSRVRLLEDLVSAMREKSGVWFARGNEIATWFRTHPEARREIDFDNSLNVPHGQSSSSAGAASPSPPRSGREGRGEVALRAPGGYLIRCSMFPTESMSSTAFQWKPTFEPLAFARQLSTRTAQPPMSVAQIQRGICEAAARPLNRATTLPAQAYTSEDFFRLGTPITSCAPAGYVSRTFPRFRTPAIF